MIYDWHTFSASEVLAVAISCITCGWCKSVGDHVACVSVHLCCGIGICARVAHLTVMFVRVVA